jgi:hypothetical protein
MTEPVTIGFGANKWVKDSDTRMVTLTADYNTTTSQAMSLYESKNGQSGSHAANTRYVVPTGKKFIILLIELSEHMVGIGRSTTANDQNGMDSSTGTNIVWKHNYSANSPNSHEHHVYIEIAAGNYIHTSYQTTSGSIAYAPKIVGVETTV